MKLDDIVGSLARSIQANGHRSGVTDLLFKWLWCWRLRYARARQGGRLPSSASQLLRWIQFQIGEDFCRSSCLFLIARRGFEGWFSLRVG